MSASIVRHVQDFRPTRLVILMLTAVSFSALIGTPAWASVNEEQQGAQTLSAIHAGKLSRSNLTGSQYEHVGEYLMGKALGYTQLHERMNSLMDQMMGSSASDQMHIYLGERYLGKSVQPTSKNAPLYGLMGVMMSGYHGSPLAGMMSRYLSANGVSSIGPGMMGYGHGTNQAARSSGMSTGAIVVIVLGSIALLALLIVLGLRMTNRRAPKAGTA